MAAAPTGMCGGRFQDCAPSNWGPTRPETASSLSNANKPVDALFEDALEVENSVNVKLDGLPSKEMDPGINGDVTPTDRELKLPDLSSDPELDSEGAAYERFKSAGLLQLRRQPSTADFLDHEPEDKTSMEWYRWKVGTVIESMEARWCIVGLIIINAIVIGIETDHGSSDSLSIFDYVLLTCFTTEVTLRIFALRNLYWKDPWNWMDLTIIVASDLEAMIRLVMSEKGPTGLAVFRLIRVLRMVRLIGMVERLATLVEAFVSACVQVVWVAILSLVFLYIFAVLFTGVVGESAELKSNPEYNQHWFDSIPASMLTLFQIMTQDDWSDVMRSVGNTLPWTWSFMLIFFLVGAIGLMNLVTAVFIEELLEKTRASRARSVEEHANNRQKLLGICCDAIKAFDADGNGQLDKEEMRQIMTELENSARLTHAFTSAGVPVESLQSKLALANVDDSGNVDVEHLLKMVETGAAPTTRDDVYEIRHLILEEATKSKHLRKTVDEILTTLQALSTEVAELRKRR